MEPEERAGRAGEGGPAEALGPAERRVEAPGGAPPQVEAEQRGEA